ncbi:MAG: apolipoprotein N-acyltransferase [Desulfomicrobium sp.]|nr:apolipoprotein N-acyltransferase [Pseudomonadota bacterium]MBU4570659.1 apolipoprotein N-acyltransferase [Pseudomonadota bacterium]MBU4593423.1 apolipoprotein N-acyltransferase [Pseudomonadota bacterium]MBV1711005.1 apolipoprotein N-acyltransferase [Desulfomicrobium sp.]MBV1719263.1 apolipoprotein N-acyltransferase [Desulfomicrobium sp.]
MRLLGPMGMALVGAWFGFANPLLHFPPAILLLPAALILTSLRATSLTHAFRSGFLTALPGYAASLYWLAIPVHDHGGLPWALALPCPVLVGALLAAYAGLFCMGVHLIRSRSAHPLAMLATGLLWASLELARNHFLTGFSWLTLAQSMAPWPQTLGLAAWIGGFGLSAVLVSLSHSLLAGRGWTRAVAPALILLCLLPALMREPRAPAATASVSMIQGNIDQSLKWDEAMQSEILAAYLDLSFKAVDKNAPEILIWPETAMPFYFQDPSDLTTGMRLGVARLGIPVLAGAPAYSAPMEPGAPQYVLHNRAYLLGGAGETLSWYDKEHLVPFGEYVPLGQWLPFITKLVPGQFEFRPGRNAAPLKTGSLAMGLLICYEAIFPELAQKQVKLGANVLVNISNDAWFGRSSAPLQHLHLSILRAVEQNRSIIRATNSGISAFIAPDGSLRGKTPLFVAEIAHDPAIELLTETTFYHEHFYFIHAAFPILAVALLGTLWRNGRKNHT